MDGWDSFVIGIDLRIYINIVQEYRKLSSDGTIGKNAVDIACTPPRFKNEYESIEKTNSRLSILLDSCKTIYIILTVKFIL